MSDKLTLIVYDIRDNKKRTNLMKLLKGYGERVQYSVFEVYLNPAKLKKLINRVNEIIDLDQDSVRYYILCGHCRNNIEISGQGEVTRDWQLYFL